MLTKSIAPKSKDSWSVSPCPFHSPPSLSLSFLSSCACCFANKVEAAKLLIIVLYILFYWPLLNTHIAALKKNVAYF